MDTKLDLLTLFEILYKKKYKLLISAIVGLIFGIIITNIFNFNRYFNYVNLSINIKIINRIYEQTKPIGLKNWGAEILSIKDQIKSIIEKEMQNPELIKNFKKTSSSNADFLNNSNIELNYISENSSNITLLYDLEVEVDKKKFLEYVNYYIDTVNDLAKKEVFDTFLSLKKSTKIEYERYSESMELAKEEFFEFSNKITHEQTLILFPIEYYTTKYRMLDMISSIDKSIESLKSNETWFVKLNGVQLTQGKYRKQKSNTIIGLIIMSFVFFTYLYYLGKYLITKVES